MAGHVDDVSIVVVSQEGLLQAVSFDETANYLAQGYRLATPAECDTYEQERRKASDIRE